MAISLTKNNPISLTKTDPLLKNLRIGLGWDADLAGGGTLDLDVTIFVTDENKRALSDMHMIYFNPAHKKSPCGAIEYHGDNKTGAGEGDDEQILIDTTKLAADVTKVVATVAIFEAAERGQNFGQIRNAYIRVFDTVSGVEIARFDLSEDCSTATTAVFGEIYKHNNEWKFRAVSQPFTGGLQELAKHFGVNV